MKRRNLILLLGGASAGAVTFGSGAFSSVEADRNVTVAVVPDEEALLGYEVREDGQSDGNGATSGLPEIVVPAGETEERTLVTITNRTTEAVKIASVEVTTHSHGGPDVIDLDWDEHPFGSGEAADIRGTIECDEEGSDVVALAVEIEGMNIDVTMAGNTNTRRFVIQCESPEPDLTSDFVPQEDDSERPPGDVKFSGLGQVELQHDERGTVDVQFYVQRNQDQNTDVTIESSDLVPTNEKIRGDRFRGESIVGVRIDDSKFIYLHPSWDQRDCRFVSSSGGTVEDPVLLADVDPETCSPS